MKSIENFVLEQQGKALQRNFDSKKETIASKLQLNQIDKYMGEMMHITIADWCTELISQHPLDVEQIVKINPENRQIVFNLMKQYWRVMNVRDKIDFHKEDNSIVLQMMIYQETIESFGFSVYNELHDTTQYKDWFAVLQEMVQKAKERVWFYITH